MAKTKKEKSKNSTISLNKKARHDYFIEDRYEAGLSLEGWEVKSIRAGRAQINESYILLQNGEAFLFGANISALPTASTHIKPDPTRNRKCLLHRTELNRLIGAVERKGFTLIPTALYWKHGLVKLEIGVIAVRGRVVARVLDSEIASACGLHLLVESKALGRVGARTV